MSTEREEYLRAMHMAQKEKKKLEAEGKTPFPAVLDDVLPDAGFCTGVDLPVQEIPADRIVGTASRSRMNVFSASFLPLPEPESEFGMKWIALCRAHLSDVGIRDPIECVEYLGNFYVQEGNKRASVLKYFGAVRIPAKIRRIMPSHGDEARLAAYREFLEFYKKTKLYDVQFKKPGDYARLYAALKKKREDDWSEEEKRRFSAVYYSFSQAFAQLGGAGRALLPEDAFVLFLEVYTYEQLCAMQQPELRRALASLWGDVQTAAEPSSINVKTTPEGETKKGVIGKLITVAGAPKHLNVAFIYQKSEAESDWTSGHAKGAAEMQAALGDAVTVREYRHADSPGQAEALLAEAAGDGADVIFTTTPPLLHAALRAAVAYPKITFFNCSACKPLSSVRSYYCRTYEGKFITGLIAGALSENGLVGYVGSYPILGVPASINAFARGARMTNPRAKILLSWSCLPGDPVASLRERGVRVISNRDIPLPDALCSSGGNYGAFLYGEDGRPRPVASPCWKWGTLYEHVVRSILNGTFEKKDQAEAVNYWWGMDSGVIDVTLTKDLPPDLKSLADTFTDLIRQGKYDPFQTKMTARDGSLICDGVKSLTSMEILKMDRLSDAVIGDIPGYGELLPMSRALVRELCIPGYALPPAGEEPI
ncbi:MAG: BMP family ABC transporter substrate-binding protein [Clostridia bacterium]|nr:BMP family ABC transporter substrate-binding protein [Clostridia bacterium]